MYPKFVYQHQNWLNPFIWRDLYCATWVKPFWPNVQSDQLTCLLVLKLKTSITKITGVSFGTAKDYMLQNLKIMSLSSRSWKPLLSHKWKDYFPSLFIFKACAPYFLHFTKIKPLKSYEKCLLFHLNALLVLAIFKF